MSLKAPSVNRPPVSRQTRNAPVMVSAIYRQHEAFRRKLDTVDETGTPCPTEGLIAQRAAAIREAYEHLHAEKVAKRLGGDEEEAEE